MAMNTAQEAELKSLSQLTILMGWIWVGIAVITMLVGFFLVGRELTGTYLLIGGVMIAAASVSFRVAEVATLVRVIQQEEQKK